MLIFVVIVLVAFLLENDAKEIENSKLSVFGYLPEYRFHSKFDYDGLFSMGLTHLIYFSLEVHFGNR